jgi:hypothetical protein
VKLKRIASTLVFALLAAACSEDDDPTPASPTSQTNPNQPAASAGSAGSAGTGSTSTAGAAGTATSTGGSTAEAPDDNLPIDSEGSEDENGEDDGSSQPPPVASADAGATPPSSDGMSFFVTSRGKEEGGNLGGLEGADALCTELATAVSAELGAKTWRAYLSTSTVNARDRIGTGPWRNAAGVIVANNVDQLVDQGTGGSLDQTWAPGDGSIALDELGNQVGFGGASGPVVHDILTGTLADGTVAEGLTCSDWTATTGTVQVGHSNRGGGGPAPSSWSSAHEMIGCAPLTAPAPNVGSGGGRGSIYCFAID